jgi:hypothetical protein
MEEGRNEELTLNSSCSLLSHGSRMGQPHVPLGENGPVPPPSLAQESNPMAQGPPSRGEREHTDEPEIPGIPRIPASPPFEVFTRRNSRAPFR